MSEDTIRREENLPIRYHPSFLSPEEVQKLTRLLYVVALEGGHQAGNERDPRKFQATENASVQVRFLNGF